MPLKKGSGKATISENISLLVREGYKVDQAAAIAFNEAGRRKKRRGTGSEPVGGLI